MKSKLFRKFTFTLCAVLMIVSAGCASSPAEPAASNGTQETTQSANPSAVPTENPNADKALLIAARDIAATLDPTVPLTADYLVNMGAGELLFKANADAAIEPSLALSAEQLDETTWEIALRPEVTFWSGKSVDADAVIASLERSRELDLKALPYLDALTFSKVGDYTIQVTTAQKNLYVPLNLSYFQLVIHNADASYESVDTVDFTGMYKIVEYTAKQKMTLEINENYWGQKPLIPKVVHEEISDAEGRVLAALSGRYHVVMNIPVTGMPQFETSDVAEIVSQPPASSETIYLNLSQPQLQDERVRQALSWALDRDELIILGAEGQSYPVTTWIGSNPAFPDAKNLYYKYDADKAATLLDEAGWLVGDGGVRYKDGTPLTVRLMTWGVDQALGEAIQSQWTRIGVKAEVSFGDYSLIQTARETGDWDATIEAWTTFGDVAALLKGQYGSDGGANYGGYNDDATNALLDKLASASSEQERHDLALQVAQRVAEQSPAIYVYPRPELTAVNKSLHGFTPHFRQFENVVNPNLTLLD